MGKRKRPSAERRLGSPLAELKERLSSAVFTLRPPVLELLGGSDGVASGVGALMRAVTEQIGAPPKAVQVFGNLGAFAVEASPEFLACLSKRSEIGTVISNDPGEDIRIRPVTPKRSRRSRPDQ
jgi:hypothetical protein